MTDRSLIELARAAMRHSYSPYSRFPVGAAIECADGRVFTGCNIENVAFGATMCAEAVALASAVSVGAREFLRIAIVSDGKTYCYPCGNCRQLLSEFSPEIEVLCVRGDGRYVSYPLTRLLAESFGKGQLG